MIPASRRVAGWMIHYGSAVVRDGDLFGHAVNVAARITALAGAGHAVITDPILPATSRAGLLATAIGTRNLRNISTPVPLHTLDLAVSPHPVDPVCGVRVDQATATRRSVGGQQWWFCSTACADRFDQSPAKGER